MSLIASYLVDAAYSITNCLSCFPSSPQLKINSRSFKIQRLLGEGGFSYVYLVQDNANAQLFALKKIRCPFGEESVSQALKEVEAYSLFAPHPNIIQCIDHTISSDKSDPGAKTVYILLPYFRRGNLQDIINANLVNHTKFPERRLMVLLLGVCRALKSMHQYRVQDKSGTGNLQKAKQVRAEAVKADLDAADEIEVEANSSRRRRKDNMRAAAEAGDTEQEPLMDDAITASQEGVEPGQKRAYAHRDIKPGNIMIADDGHTPILMDLGSLAPSPTEITSRSLAIAVQDEAAEHSTMPYRAPELFDVKTDSVVDTKVDIWSLGCTIYACLVGKSPFEARSEETGGSLTMCILGADWRFPDEGSSVGRGKAKQPTQPQAQLQQQQQQQQEVTNAADGNSINEGIRDIVRKCLRVEPSERPSVDELIQLVEKVVAELPDEDI